ncbi:hypothetical protein [Ammoniphilus sp. 3BR4]
MKKTKDGGSDLTLPQNIEELLERLESMEEIEAFATRLVKEYYKDVWAG